MIERRGTKTCEICGEEYEWILRMPVSDGLHWGDTNCVNVQHYEIFKGRLIATGRCQYCGAMQVKPLLDEEL